MSADALPSCFVGFGRRRLGVLLNRLWSRLARLLEVVQGFKVNWDILDFLTRILLVSALIFLARWTWLVIQPTSSAVRVCMDCPRDLDDLNAALCWWCLPD